jgi:hypothetical protein
MYTWTLGWRHSPGLSGGTLYARLINGDRGYLGYATWRKYLKFAQGYTAAQPDGAVSYTAHELRHVCASLPFIAYNWITIALNSSDVINRDTVKLSYITQCVITLLVYYLSCHMETF